MRLVFDLETDGLLPEVTKIHCVVAQDLETGMVFKWHPCDIEGALDFLSEATELWGHNIIGYDIPVLEKLYPDWKHDAVVRDTQVYAQLLWPDLKPTDYRRINAGVDFPRKYAGRHSLAAWGYRLGELKGDFGQTTDWSEFSEEMMEYCAQDVAVTVKLHQRCLRESWLPEASVDLEHKFATVLSAQERKGVYFAQPAAHDLVKKLRDTPS